VPFALLIIGVWLLIAGVRDTAGPSNKPGTLFYLIRGDFTGPDNFVYWFIAILLIGAVGYIPKLKPVSTAFLTLVIVVLFLKKGSSTGVGGGFFQQFMSGIGITQNANPRTQATIQSDLNANLAQLQAAQNSVSQSINNNLSAMDSTIAAAGSK
jgi:hypothetical protein